MPTLEQITERVRAGLADSSPLDRTLKIDLGGEGVLWIGGGSVSNSDEPADLTITTTKADLEAMGSGKLDPVSALMSGRMRMSDMALAVRVQPELRALFKRMR